MNEVLTMEEEVWRTVDRAEDGVPDKVACWREPNMESEGQRQLGHRMRASVVSLEQRCSPCRDRKDLSGLVRVAPDVVTEDLCVGGHLPGEWADDDRMHERCIEARWRCPASISQARLMGRPSS